MKKIKSLMLLTMLVGAITISSCKKDKTNLSASSYITATIDGTAVNFNTQAVAIKGSGQAAGVTILEGAGANGATFSLTFASPLVAGKSYVTGAADPNNSALVQYSTATDDFINADVDQGSPFTVTITSVSSTSVQGTFQGKVANEVVIVNGGQAKIEMITNGKFSLNFK